MIYNLLLAAGGLTSLPKWLLQKKYQGTLRQRFGLTLPAKPDTKPVIWLHMVSMGETKAMIPIYQKLRQKYPNANFYLSSTTATGHQEAKRSLPGGKDYFFLPLDLSYLMKRLVKYLSPDLLILSESDFWLNLMRQTQHFGGKVILLNGKISEKSTSRFAKLPSFTQKLFTQIDHFCIQSPEYKTAFTRLKIPQEKMTLTGNLKLAIPTPQLTPEEKANWQARFNLKLTDQVITLGSTHEGEEALLLTALPPDAKILLVPRHPERFDAVRNLIQSLNNPNIILVDQMGILPICYQLSSLAIVGGSFLPGVGGHNIFEPIQAQIPVLFGPYMETQKELVNLVLEAEAGFQIPAENLPDALKKALTLKANAEKLSTHGTDVLETTWQMLEKFLPTS